jgi:hypothetical protein
VETTYAINSVISKLMTFVENAETGQFLFLMVLSDRPYYYLNDEPKNLAPYITIFLRK